jgi:hypothetical protein
MIRLADSSSILQRKGFLNGERDYVRDRLALMPFGVRGGDYQAA